VISDIREQLLIRYSAFSRHWRRNGRIVGQYIGYVYISRKSMTQSGEKYWTMPSVN
jgi:hypothetical protein